MHLEWFGISATIKSLLCPQIYIWVAVAPGTVGRGCKAVLSKYICPAPGSFLCHIKKGVMQAERQLSGRAISVPKWAAALGSIPYTGDWGSTVLRDRGRIWPCDCVFLTCYLRLIREQERELDCFPGGWGEESQLTGKSEVKGCSSPSHTGTVVALPFAVSTQGQEWARHAGHCSQRPARRWLCSSGLGSGAPLFSFLCGAVRPGWAGRLSSTSAEHVLPHAGEVGLAFFLEGGRVRAEPSPCVSHLPVTTGWAVRQLAGRSACGWATVLLCQSWLGLSVSGPQPWPH